MKVWITIAEAARRGLWEKSAQEPLERKVDPRTGELLVAVEETPAEYSERFLRRIQPNLDRLKQIKSEMSAVCAQLRREREARARRGRVLRFPSGRRIRRAA
ncbi:MAG TPA: hypothetical protein DEA08_00195 [Planctomycetes bacterium]|nr:hypothetical protein [Planctomycetota bacterium]